ncbi:HAD-IA family hydrolase [Candidatus Bathyarchaeota archaeon]|nr:HAD-IA family hydrolase [Candidatus Bathyarchaeota archaeon]
MKKVDLMIFDFDGTLVSTGADLIQAINYTLNALKLKKKQEKEILSFVGDGISKLIERALEQDHIKHHEEAMSIFSEYYGQHLLDNTRLYPQAEEVLKNFENMTKAILTNKRYNFTLAIAQGLNIAKYFVEIIGAGSTPFQKPDRRVIDYLLNKYGVAKENTLIIGDGINDIAVAKNSGILSCAYLNGLGIRQDLLSLNADYYVENLLEINTLFC